MFGSYLAILGTIPLQISVDNTFPRYDGTFMSQQHSTLIYGKSQGNGRFLQFPCVYDIGVLAGVPSLTYEEIGPTG